MEEVAALQAGRALSVSPAQLRPSLQEQARPSPSMIPPPPAPFSRLCIKYLPLYSESGLTVVLHGMSSSEPARLYCWASVGPVDGI